MLKLLFLLLFSTLWLLADYSKALQYYNAARYKEAIIEAKKSTSSYSNPNLHLLWAISAEQLGHTNEAMSAYERVLLLDKSNIRAQKALHSIYEKTKRYELLENKTKTKNNLNAKVAISFGYDNNLDATPDSDTLQDYFGDTLSSDTTSSTFMRVSAFVDYTYHFSDTKQWYSKYILRGYSQSNHDTNASYYDLKTASIEAGLGYNAKTHNIYFPISYHKVNYLDKNLLSQIRFNPKILIPLDNNKLLDINILYSQNKYIHSEDKIKDDTTYAIEVGNYFLHQKDFTSVHFKYEHHSALNAFPSKYIGANFWTLKLGAKHIVTSNLVATLNYRFRYGQYDDVVGTSITTRDDNFHQLDTKLTYAWSKKSNLFIADSYTENKSNSPAAVYQKNNISLGIDFSF